MIKQKVKDLCVELRKTEIGTERWKEIKRQLLNKWKFTAFNLLALFQNPPTIEYSQENVDLILQMEEKKNVTKTL